MKGTLTEAGILAFLEEMLCDEKEDCLDETRRGRTVRWRPPEWTAEDLTLLGYGFSLKEFETLKPEDVLRRKSFWVSYRASMLAMLFLRKSWRKSAEGMAMTFESCPGAFLQLAATEIDRTITFLSRYRQMLRGISKKDYAGLAEENDRQSASISREIQGLQRKVEDRNRAAVELREAAKARGLLVASPAEHLARLAGRADSPGAEPTNKEEE